MKGSLRLEGGSGSLLRDDYVAALGESGGGRAVGYADRKVHGDRGAGFNGLAMLIDGLEVPFANRLLGRRGEDGRTAQHPQILDHAIGCDQSLQHNRSLHIHVLRKRRVRRHDGFGEPFTFGSVRRGSHSRRLLDRRIRRLQDLNSLRVASRMQVAVIVSGDHFYIQRRQDRPVRNDGGSLCRCWLSWSARGLNLLFRHGS